MVMFELIGGVEGGIGHPTLHPRLGAMMYVVIEKLIIKIIV